MFRVSCIQLKSNDNIKKNIFETEKLIKKAVSQKADFILTPEVSSIFLQDKKKLLNECTRMHQDKYLKNIKRLAKSYKKWILIGSLVIKVKRNKLVNRSVLVDGKGKVVSFYDKIHMYDVNLSKTERYSESKTFSSGKCLKISNLPWGKLGMSICYDLRFPNLYRRLAKKGALFLSVPSAFTETTGKRHWHSLLKARAIENFCYIFAPAQGGTHYNGRKTYGHSAIISPDGKILKELGKKKGVITATIDSSAAKKLRQIIPSLKKN